MTPAQHLAERMALLAMADREVTEPVFECSVCLDQAYLHRETEQGTLARFCECRLGFSVEVGFWTDKFMRATELQTGRLREVYQERLRQHAGGLRLKDFVDAALRKPQRGERGQRPQRDHYPD